VFVTIAEAILSGGNGGRPLFCASAKLLQMKKEAQPSN
jgi:hypothetical protein